MGCQRRPTQFGGAPLRSNGQKGVRKSADRVVTFCGMITYGLFVVTDRQKCSGGELRFLGVGAKKIGALSTSIHRKRSFRGVTT